MRRAIDISHWEGTYSTNTPPNWAGAVLDGVEVGVMKAMEKRTADSMFEYNWRAMERQGLTRGGYHFWNPTDTNYEADLFCRTLLGKDTTLEFLPIVDFEPSLTVYTTRIPGVDIKLKAFLDRVELRTGIKPLIYTGKPYWERHFPVTPTWLINYKLWLAAYPNRISTIKNQWDLTAYSYQIPTLPRGWLLPQLYMWQFSDKGIIPGFSGGVDLNYIY